MEKLPQECLDKLAKMYIKDQVYDLSTYVENQHSWKITSDDVILVISPFSKTEI